ncbi:MAG: hypothetical protein ABI901_06190, partial [Roseiflexaceae bacterium]
AWAKREYLRTAGPGSFGVYDEKVLEELTLYGLPFIHVNVPSPNNNPYLGAFDPAARPVPDNIRTLLTPTGTFTRTVTITIAASDFTVENVGGDMVPRVKHATLLDSFAPAETIALTGTDEMAAGKPVLPLLTYDLTLTNTELFGGTGGIPEPRGVRLLSATTLPDLSGFNPHVTTITTDTTFAQQQDDPNMTVQDQWLPDQPYTFLRTSDGGQYTDKLLVNPAQFQATSARSGQLRRFTQLVFEVNYLDPNSAPSSALSDETPPEISDVTISLPQQRARQAGIAAQPQITVKANVHDEGGTGGPLDVSVTYTVDGKKWLFKPLTFDASLGVYTTGIESPLPGQNIALLVEARDGAGNVATYTAKGTMNAFSILTLPVLLR